MEVGPWIIAQLWTISCPAQPFTVDKFYFIIIFIIIFGNCFTPNGVCCQFLTLGEEFVLLPLLPNSWTSAPLTYKLSKGCVSHLPSSVPFFPPLERSWIGFHLLSFQRINQISWVTGRLAIASHRGCLAEVSLHVVLIHEPSLVPVSFARRKLWHTHKQISSC